MTWGGREVYRLCGVIVSTSCTQIETIVVYDIIGREKGGGGHQ